MINWAPSMSYCCYTMYFYENEIPLVMISSSYRGTYETRDSSRLWFRRVVFSYFPFSKKLCLLPRVINTKYWEKPLYNKMPIIVFVIKMGKIDMPSVSIWRRVPFHYSVASLVARACTIDTNKNHMAIWSQLDQWMGCCQIGHIVSYGPSIGFQLRDPCKIPPNPLLPINEIPGCDDIYVCIPN